MITTSIILIILLLIFVGLCAYFFLQWQKVQTHNTQLQNTLHQNEILLTRLQEEKKQTATTISSLTRFKTDHKTEMTEQFENIANKILTEKDSHLVQNNKKTMETLLGPLHTQLNTFRQDIQNTNQENAKERASLKTYIDQLQSNIGNVSQRADNLSRALRGDKKQQGNWGEFMLEKVLEDSGLEKNVNYRLQVALKNEDGERRLPDCVIDLPENRQLIVDSKVSLNAYNDFINADDDATREQAIKLHLQAINKHINELAGKNYSNLETVRSPDFVFIFLPIESAFHAAVQYDRQLLQNASQKGIVLASPTTLLAMLKMVTYLWKIEKQQKNAEEIATRGGRLYDKFCGFLDDMESMNKSITGLQSTYDKAIKKLSTGQGNLLNQTQEMKKLGIKHQKNIPSSFDTEADESDDKA